MYSLVLEKVDILGCGSSEVGQLGLGDEHVESMGLKPAIDMENINLVCVRNFWIILRVTLAQVHELIFGCRSQLAAVQQRSLSKPKKEKMNFGLGVCIRALKLVNLSDILSPPSVLLIELRLQWRRCTGPFWYREWAWQGRDGRGLCTRKFSTLCAN